MRITYPFLWDEQHLCFGFSNHFGKRCGVYSLKLLNLNNLNICDNLINCKERVLWHVNKIKHPIYGDCLITELHLDNIGLWTKKNNNNV